MNVAAPVILAIASPPGRSLRGIVRISGNQAFSLLGDLLKPPGAGEGDAGFHVEPGLHPARLQLERLSVAVMALIFAGPRSYTGEHAAELQMPGNPLLLERVLDAMLREADKRHIDARRAEPGEFTARAYLNGRISLTQAEGVAATIAAQSDAQLRAAHLLLGGRLGGLAHEVADELAACLALVEAGIDFTDQEDVVAISPGDLHVRLAGLHHRIDRQLARAVGSERLDAVPWVLLRGRPNAGKSALFNALLGHERAVVSPVAGTTRDVIAEPLQIDTPHGPAEVMLIDLAGQDDLDPSEINRLMQASARAAADRAELILHCVPFAEEPGLARTEGDGRSIVVRTKADLVLKNMPIQSSEIAVSALTGRGISDLRARIAGQLADRAVSLAADALVLTPRHDAAMRSARDHLAEAIGLVAPFGGSRHAPNPELIASSMRASLNALAELAGDITPDDVLGRVFSSFCVGK